MPNISFRDQSIPLVSMDKLMPSEIDAIERACGLTFKRIQRMAETCVCEHGKRDHQHKDDLGEIDQTNTSCLVCSNCDQHESDLPTRVSIAMLWVQIKRVIPSLQYTDVSSTPLDELQKDVEGEPVSADPTSPPPSVG